MGTKKILIADDEARMRKLVADFLKKDGYLVVEAADGQEALDLFLRTGDVDLIILDVMMPGYDGWPGLEGVNEFLRAGYVSVGNHSRIRGSTPRVPPSLSAKALRAAMVGLQMTDSALRNTSTPSSMNAKNISEREVFWLER